MAAIFGGGFNIAVGARSSTLSTCRRRSAKEVIVQLGRLHQSSRDMRINGPETKPLKGVIHHSKYGSMPSEALADRLLRMMIRAQAFQRKMASSFPAGRIASALS